MWLLLLLLLPLLPLPLQHVLVVLLLLLLLLLVLLLLLPLLLLLSPLQPPLLLLLLLLLPMAPPLRASSPRSRLCCRPQLTPLQHRMHLAGFNSQLKLTQTHVFIIVVIFVTVAVVRRSAGVTWLGRSSCTFACASATCGAASVPAPASARAGAGSGCVKAHARGELCNSRRSCCARHKQRFAVGIPCSFQSGTPVVQNAGDCGVHAVHGHCFVGCFARVAIENEHVVDLLSAEIPHVAVQI